MTPFFDGNLWKICFFTNSSKHRQKTLPKLLHLHRLLLDTSKSGLFENNRSVRQNKFQFSVRKWKSNGAKSNWTSAKSCKALITFQMFIDIPSSRCCYWNQTKPEGAIQHVFRASECLIEMRNPGHIHTHTHEAYQSNERKNNFS